VSPTGLRGVDLGVADVPAAKAFFTDIWRLSVAAERDGSVYLRGTGAYHHILALHPRPKAELLRVNLAAASRSEVDALHDRAARCAPQEIRAPAEVQEPGGGYAFSLRDPDGRVLRVIAGDARHRDTGSDPDRPGKITHIVLNTPQQEKAAAFWVEALGFQVSDRSLLTFIRCNSEHHNIAFHPGKHETLHHIAFEVPDIDAVMRGVGRMRDAGHPIEWGPGRHGPGNNVFAYFVGPEGYVIEYTAEVERVDESHRAHAPEHWKYPPGHSDLWGATPPPTARMKEAQDRIGFAGEPL
jgi:catechol-2,3-dioxygenase